MEVKDRIAKAKANINILKDNFFYNFEFDYWEDYDEILVNCDCLRYHLEIWLAEDVDGSRFKVVNDDWDIILDVNDAKAIVKFIEKYFKN